MPIKLLPKQEISRLQANEQRIKVEEGAKLARRVDTLREIAAKEEASLASFRAKTVAAIAAEVKVVTQERDNLLAQLQPIRDEIERGTKVLDERENTLDERMYALQEREVTLDKRLVALQKLADKVAKQEKANNAYFEQLKTAHNVINQVKNDTLNRNEEVRALVGQISSYADSSRTLLEDMERELRTRDIEVASRERDVTIKEERLNKKERELYEQAVKLIDREQTLERELKRLKKI